MATLRRRILLSLLAVLSLAVAALAYTLSHETACEPAPALAAGTATMKAVVRRCYGPPDVLALEDVEKPVAEGRRAPGQGSRRQRQSGRLALRARRALHHPHGLRIRRAEKPAHRHRLCRHGRGGRQERHEVQAGRRGVRREERRARRVHDDCGDRKLRPEACRHQLRAGGGRATSPGSPHCRRCATARQSSPGRRS